MGLFANGIQALKKTGLSGLMKETWLRVLIRSKLSKGFSLALGREFHEKLAQSVCVGYWPNYDDPQTFNEHISYRKLSTNNKLFVTVSDKYSVRKYVEEKVGQEILTQLYYVTDNPNTIPFEKLPNEFVIKSTHGSGQVIIVDDKETADFAKIKSRCAKWLSTNFGQNVGEYWYTNIQPKIIIEEKIESSHGKVPRDYKIFVFHGSAEYIQVNMGRFSDLTERFYDPEWRPMEFTHAYQKGPEIEKPNNLEQMLEVAEALGSDFDFARIDLYQTKDGVVFGEITLAPGSGYLWFNPKIWDYKLGALW